MLTADVDIDKDNPDRILVRSNFHAKDSIKAVPGARWDTTRRVWTVPKSWTACLALRTEFGEGLTVQPALKDWASKTSAEKKVLASWRGLVDTDSDVLPPDSMPSRPGFEGLFGHQKVDALAIARARRYLLLNETGTGKSRSALAGLAMIEEAGDDVFPLMIVAPKSMLITWSREVEGFFPGKDVRVCQATPSKMRDLLKPGGDVYVVSWDSVRQYSRLSPYGNTKLLDDEKLDKELQAIGFTSAIVDEIHRGKNGEAKRTRAIWAATKTCTNVIGLTGTPVQDTPQDLWALLRTIAPDEYPTKSAYVERFLQVSWNHWGGRDITGLREDTSGEFFSNFDAVSRRVTKDMSLDLPEKVYSTRWVELPAKLRKAYDSMQNTLIAELEESTMASENVLERQIRLLQLANSWGEVDEDGKFTMLAPSPKIDAFMEDIAEGDFGENQVVVFSDSRQLVDLLEIQMRKKKQTFVSITGAVTGEERQEAIDRFQSGEVQFCLVTRAGGEGVTLTAASTMVRLVRSWSHTIHRQAEDRVHRIGSEIHDQITYIDYVTDDTVECAQLVKLNAKEERAQEILRDRELLEILKKTRDDAKIKVETRKKIT